MNLDKIKGEHLAAAGILLVLFAIFLLYRSSEIARQNDTQARESLKNFQSVLQGAVIANNGLFHEEESLLCKNTTQCRTYYPDLKVNENHQVCMFLSHNEIKKLCVCHQDGATEGYCVEGGQITAKSICYC